MDSLLLYFEFFLHLIVSSRLFPYEKQTTLRYFNLNQVNHFFFWEEQIVLNNNNTWVIVDQWWRKSSTLLFWCWFHFYRSFEFTQWKSGNKTYTYIDITWWDMLLFFLLANANCVYAQTLAQQMNKNSTVWFFACEIVRITQLLLLIWNSFNWINMCIHI